MKIVVQSNCNPALYLGFLMTYLIWQFSEEECHTVENKQITKLLHLESCKIIINIVFGGGCEEINLRIRVELEIGNMVQYYILALPRELKELIQSHKAS